MGYILNNIDIIPEGLSLASEVNQHTPLMSMVDQSLNCDHHCSTATAIIRNRGEGIQSLVKVYAW